MERNFRDLCEAQWDKGKFLCVGLDSDLQKLPQAARVEGVHETLVNFNRAIISETKDIAGSYKLNSAFYEAHGELGWSAMQETIEYIHEEAPDLPVILDAKRADIGSTNAGYIAAIFEDLDADAVTLHPYPGRMALAPFLALKDKGMIVWCRSSNEGGGEFQDLLIDGEPLYIHVARHVANEWNGNGNCALVTGATYPEEMKKIREVSDDLPFLIPGIGAQGGDLLKTIECGKDSRGKGMLIHSARGIIYASQDADFATAARQKALELDGAIREALV